MFVQVNSFAIFRVPVIVCAHFAIEVVTHAPILTLIAANR